MSSELILIFLIAILVFGPGKLPMLAQHLGKLFCYFNQLKQQLSVFWQTQLQEQQLQENIRKAEKGDLDYPNESTTNQSDL